MAEVYTYAGALLANQAGGGWCAECARARPPRWRPPPPSPAAALSALAFAAGSAKQDGTPPPPVCMASCRPLARRRLRPRLRPLHRSEFTWIFVCSIFLAIFVAYGEGGAGQSKCGQAASKAIRERLSCRACRSTRSLSSPAHSLVPPPPPQASAQMTWQMLSAPLWVSDDRMALPPPEDSRHSPSRACLLLPLARWHPRCCGRAWWRQCRSSPPHTCLQANHSAAPLPPHPTTTSHTPHPTSHNHIPHPTPLPPSHPPTVSPGAKALTMKQALVIAAICEFGGAVLLGAGRLGLGSAVWQGALQHRPRTAAPSCHHPPTHPPTTMCRQYPPRPGHTSVSYALARLQLNPMTLSDPPAAVAAASQA